MYPEPQNCTMAFSKYLTFWKTWLIIIILSLSIQSNAQQLTGASGICIVDGNPNNIPDIATVDVTSDCTTSYNGLTGDRWKYNPQRPEGDRWVMESNSGDTNIDSLDVNAGLFRIREAGTFYTLDVKEIAPIQTLGTNTPTQLDISEPVAGSGDWIINMTETPVQVAMVGNQITITNEIDEEFTFTAGETDVTITGVGDIVVTESTPNNFIASFSETVINIDTSVPNEVTITDEAGTPTTFVTADDVKDIIGAGDIQVNEVGTTGTYVVSFVENVIQVIQNDSLITIINEDGIPASFVVGGSGGSGLTLHGIYDNDTDAASNGCPVGAFYETSLTNTLGEPVGMIRKRIN